MLQKCLEIVQASINNANKQSYQQSKLSTARICISVKNYLSIIRSMNKRFFPYSPLFSV